jgi:hypothetical protein
MEMLAAMRFEKVVQVMVVRSCCEADGDSGLASRLIPPSSEF